MRLPRFPLLLALAPLAAACAAPRLGEGGPALRTVAVRVHHEDAMLRFYRDAFGFAFRPVRTGGLTSQFGERDGLTLELVPIRAGADFVGFPSHQLGFVVDDVHAVRELAERYGGRIEGAVGEWDGRPHAAVRDPDGNTVELYGRRPAAGGAR